MQNVSNEAGRDPIIVDRSLSSIREAHVMLQNLRSAPATLDVLTWQIHLCDLLLHEISGVRHRLAKGVRARRGNAGPKASPHIAGVVWHEHSRPRLANAEFY